VRRLAVAGAILAMALGSSACSTSATSFSKCTRAEDSIFMLMAQAVPSATRLPCVAELPVGWQFAGSAIQNGRVQLWLNSDLAGPRAVEVVFRASCDIGDAVQVPPAPDEIGMQTYIEPGLPPGFTGSKYLRFEGGCVTYLFRFAGDAPPSLALEAEEALSFLPRTTIVTEVREKLDQTLCGAGAPPCIG
jgi:hypothetical protein